MVYLNVGGLRFLDILTHHNNIYYNIIICNMGLLLPNVAQFILNNLI